MAEEKKPTKKKISGKGYVLTILTLPVIISCMIAAYKEYRKRYPYDDTNKTYTEYIDGQPIIGNQVKMNQEALIYPSPDSAICCSDSDKKEPYFSLDKIRTVIAAVYEIQNDFEIVTDRSQEATIIYNGGELVAVKTKVDGEDEGYFRKEAIYTYTKENEEAIYTKENEKVYSLGA